MKIIKLGLLALIPAVLAGCVMDEQPAYHGGYRSEGGYYGRHHYYNDGYRSHGGYNGGYSNAPVYRGGNNVAPPSTTSGGYSSSNAAPPSTTSNRGFGHAGGVPASAPSAAPRAYTSTNATPTPSAPVVRKSGNPSLPSEPASTRLKPETSMNHPQPSQPMEKTAHGGYSSSSQKNG